MPAGGKGVVTSRKESSVKKVQKKTLNNKKDEKSLGSKEGSDKSSQGKGSINSAASDSNKSSAKADSEEAHGLKIKDGLSEETTGDTKAESNDSKTGSPLTPDEEDEQLIEMEETEENRPYSASSITVKKELRLMNNLKYNTRGTQTFNHPLCKAQCQTEPSPCSNVSVTASQWVIYDAYQEEQEKQAENKGKPRATSMKSGPNKSEITINRGLASILERMVHQNTFNDIAQDFKYFEDTSDEFTQTGSLLPLWEFQYATAKGLSVTALCWNNTYKYLFAVGMGSCDPSNVNHGELNIYSLSCTFPEYSYTATSSLLCLDFHKQHPYLVAAGFYDGSVAVYNLRCKQVEPVSKSYPKTDNDTNPVWQVHWQNDDINHNHNFCSVWSDGQVVSWTLVENELVFTNIVKLTPNCVIFESLDMDCCTSLDFHKQMDDLFLVGTETGKIHKCNTGTKPFLDTIEAHSMSVNAVKWNPFHPNMFMSCSSDWTVKIWDNTSNMSKIIFEMRSGVADVAWSPYSSTVFAAVTADGKVHVFDLSLNYVQALCVQKVVVEKNTKLTCVEFNPIYPVIIVGDDQGYVKTFKLSPNLRKKIRLRRGEPLEGHQAEAAKIEALLTRLQKLDDKTVHQDKN